MKIIGQSIESGKPVFLISFHGEHPEPYSDEQLKVLKQEQIKEFFGLIGCSFIMTSIFFGLVLIL